MKKAYRYFGAIVVVMVALFLIVANFSAAESRLRCVGEISSDGSTEAATVFIRLSEYRWWVGLWSDSDGSLNLEIPNTLFESYVHLTKLNNQLVIYDTDKRLKG